MLSTVCPILLWPKHNPKHEHLICIEVWPGIYWCNIIFKLPATTVVLLVFLTLKHCVGFWGNIKNPSDVGDMGIEKDCLLIKYKIFSWMSNETQLLWQKDHSNTPEEKKKVKRGMLITAVWIERHVRQDDAPQEMLYYSRLQRGHLCVHAH